MKKASIYILTSVFIFLSVLPAQSKSGSEVIVSAMPAGIPAEATTSPVPSTHIRINTVENPAIGTVEPTKDTKKTRANKSTHDGLGGGVYISVGAIIIILLLLIIFL